MNFQRMHEQGPQRRGWQEHGGPPGGGGWEHGGWPRPGGWRQGGQQPGDWPGQGAPTPAQEPWQQPAGPREPRSGVRRRASTHQRTGPGGPVPGRPLALVLGVLATLGLLGATLGFAVDLFIAPARLLTADVEESLHLMASLIGIGGAFELYRGGRQGRTLVLVSLGLNLLATLVFSSEKLGQLETLLPMLTWLALAILVVVARQPSPAAR